VTPAHVWPLFSLLLAACAPKDPIAIGNAWIRAPAPGLAVAAGYVDIANAGPGPIALTGARSPAAGTIEIHVETREGDMMQMRRIESVPIPSGQTVSLAPGGTHLMLLRFAGTTSRLPVTLEFSDGTQREVEFELRPIDATTTTGTTR
jgi:periplasmic copper chaperone A